MKVKTGDKIKIVRKGDWDWAASDYQGDTDCMDIYIGKTLTVEGESWGAGTHGQLIAVKTVEGGGWTFYSDSFEVLDGVKEEMVVADGVVEVLETQVKEKKVKKEQLKMARNLYGVFSKVGELEVTEHSREDAREAKRWLDEQYPSDGKHTIMKLVPEKKVR